MACGCHDLFHQSLYIVAVLLVVVTLWNVCGVLLGIIMGYTCRVHTDINEVVTHLQDEVVDGYLRDGGLNLAAFCQTTILLDRFVKGFLIDKGKGCLLDVEQDADFTVADALVV